MRHLWKTVLIALALSGCVSDSTSLYISGNAVPTQEEGACSVDPTSVTVELRGTYNVDFPAPYTALAIVNSTLRNLGSDMRADTNSILVDRATVELLDSAGDPLALGALPNPFSVPVSIFVPSSDDPQSASPQVGYVELIPNSYRAALAGAIGSTIVASVVVSGETLGEIDVESGAWTYPIDICGGGCLFQCVPEDINVWCSPGQDRNSAVTPLTDLGGATATDLGLCP